MFSYIIERQGIYCDNMSKGDTLRHEVWWRYEVVSGILLPYRHVNVMAFKVKDFRGVNNIGRLVQGDCDDLKGLRHEYWVIVYHSDSDWHVIELIAEVIDSYLGCVGAHLVETYGGDLDLRLILECRLSQRHSVNNLHQIIAAIRIKKGRYQDIRLLIEMYYDRVIWCLR